MSGGLQQYRVVACVLVGFISALFLAFVCAIGSEQYEGIRDDLPKIDRLQKKTNVRQDQAHLAASHEAAWLFACPVKSLSMLCVRACVRARACIRMTPSRHCMTAS